MTNQKGSATVILLVVLVVVLAAVLVYFAFLKKPGEVAVSPTPTPTATANLMANWKTYTNTKYGFEVKYPETWTVVNNLENGANIADPQDVDHRRISVFVYQSDPDGSVRDVNQITSITSTKFQGLDAKKYSGESGVTGKGVIILVVKSNNLFYELGAPTDLYTQVLSTFKFTK